MIPYKFRLDKVTSKHCIQVQCCEPVMSANTKCLYYEPQIASVKYTHDPENTLNLYSINHYSISYCPNSLDLLLINM